MEKFSYKYNNDLTFYFKSPQELIYFQKKVTNIRTIENLKRVYNNMYGLAITDEMAYLLMYARLSKNYFSVNCYGVDLWRDDVEKMLAFQPKLIDKLKDITQKPKE